MMPKQTGSSTAVRFVHTLGALVMTVGILGVVGYLGRAVGAGKGPFEILSGLAGFSIVVCFGYWTLSSHPKAASYWWAVLGPFFIGIAPISFLLLATTSELRRGSGE